MVAEIRLETGGLKVGEALVVNGPNTGVVEFQPSEIRVSLLPVSEALKGDLCSIPTDVKLRRSDKIYRLVDASEVLAQ